MKTKLTLTTCILILFAGVVHAQTANAPKSDSWQQYRVAGEVFSVALPVLPALHINHKWLEGDKKPRREILVGSYADSVVYVISVLENPGSKVSLDDFAAAQINSSYAWNGAWDVKNRRNVSRDGVSGKSYLPVTPGGGMVQFFAGDERLYDFRAFGASHEDPRLTKFFSSVSFKKKTAVEVFEGPGLPFEPAQPEAAGSETPARIFVGRDVTVKARLAMKPEPNYTEDARLNAIVGTVVLKCVFASNGSVNNIRTVSGLPYGLTQKAIEAARRIKFIPATKDGKHVSMWMQLEYNFNLF